MDQTKFEERMGAGEAFHALQVPHGAWTVLRLDGRGFSQFTKQHFHKPFDVRFHEIMCHTAQVLLREWEGVYAYTKSDEISLLLPLNWTHFDREVEKIISLSAATASVAFSQSCGEAAHFDSRIWMGDGEALFDYFRWRQSDARRCALNGWCYWMLRREGLSVNAAAQALEKQSVEQKMVLLRERDTDFEAQPSWQRLGVGLFWETYQKQGFNPIEQQEVTVARRRMAIREELPFGDAYAAWIAELIGLEEGDLGQGASSSRKL